MIPSPTSIEFKTSLLILSQIPGIGSMRLRGLITRFGDHERILSASPHDLLQVPGIGDSSAEQIVSFSKSPSKPAAAEAKAIGQLELLEKCNAKLLTIWDKDYPEALREIYDPPTVLFVRGNLLPQDHRAIAIVGTRQATEYGKTVTRKLCRELGLNGFTIVSGLAYGIDIAAHSAALEASARTIAVLGCGADKIYTDPNGRLYPKIIEHGAILSEEWLGTEPIAENFPKRNRIISGLSLGTVIVESDIKGGALITAAYALDQNREVFAVPGSILSRKSNGTNELIRDGKAKLVLSAEDILNELKLPLGIEVAGKPEPKAPQVDLNENEKTVLKALTAEPQHIDTISEKTGLDISALLVILFELEIKRVAEQLPGKLFKRLVDFPSQRMFEF
jgi:DNA processing protein